MKIRPTLLILLPLFFTCITTEARSQELMALDVYNYAVGDEFHFLDTTTYINDFPSVFKEIVKSKYSTDDSLYYDFDVFTDDTVLTRMVVIALNDLGKPVLDTSQLNLIERTEIRHMGRYSVEYTYTVTDENGGIVFMKDRFSKGLGNTYHVEEEPGRRYAYSLVYYKSGRDSAGIPAVTKTELMQGKPEVIVNPDPFRDTARVMFINAPIGMEILDMRMIDSAGMEVMHTPVYPEVPHIIKAHESLKPGIYYLVLEAGDFRFVKKIEFKP